jgi:S-adenosyl-L-methionine hydrolase (adenosine-forming)
LIITLTTDFGMSDAFVGAMKGVILGINPRAQIVDISHEIPPQDIDRAAFVVKSAAPCFPKTTIHVVVVDPGVGTERLILAVRTEEGMFLAPNNGVLKYVFDGHPGAEVFNVTRSEYFRGRVNRTFHGRDIFAPVAAHLSKGLQPEKLGKPFADFERGSVARPVHSRNGITGVIIAFDRFGNGVTNIPAEWTGGRIFFPTEGPAPVRIENPVMVGIEDPDSAQVEDPVLDGIGDRGHATEDSGAVRVRVGGRTFGSLSRSYLDVAAGEPLVLAGSADSLEISVNRGNAKAALDLKLGDAVEVLFF